MREARPRERRVGMEYYASETDGVGGKLRESPADFRVREIETTEPEPLDADPERFRHLLVRVTLTGWDTNDFAGELSDRMGISRERVAWAGTKDKHAVTTQLFSIEGVHEDDLPEIADAEVEPVGRFGRRLYLGDLAGNEFEIAVRDPECPENVEAITGELAAFASFENGDADGPDATATVGVPNYFGQQRFGSHRPITHEVGLAIVRENWEEAVLTYVANPHEGEPAETREAREFVAETRDWTRGLEELPGHLGYERAMLHRLAEGEGDPDGADFRAALEAVPRNLQTLFVNAAQSYAFNLMLSRRLERGLPFDRALEGDVVCFAETHDDLVVPDPDRSQRVTENRVEAVNRHLERGRAFVTAPLVGTETELGEGEPGEIEREVLADLDLSPADFDLPEPFASTGTRRAILLPVDLHDSRDPLAFSFSLPKGSYATVVLREYLKTDPDAMA